MGDGQSKVEARVAQKLQDKYLRTCALVIASSDNMADALASEYSISRPLAAYNVPPKTGDLPNRRADGLKLYWRNSVIGFGQRGLEDASEAMTLLPAAVKLFLQGRLPTDGGTSLNKRIERLELVGRVVVLPPYSPESAVHQAALYDVVLCMERQGPRNHDLTVSNKIFDYHMAGLAVIATDLAGLADVVRRSGAGSGFTCEGRFAVAIRPRTAQRFPDKRQTIRHGRSKFGARSRKNQICDAVGDSSQRG
jgi:hypothetical protein